MDGDQEKGSLGRAWRTIKDRASETFLGKRSDAENRRAEIDVTEDDYQTAQRVIGEVPKTAAVGDLEDRDEARELADKGAEGIGRLAEHVKRPGLLSRRNRLTRRLALLGGGALAVEAVHQALPKEDNEALRKRAEDALRRVDELTAENGGLREERDHAASERDKAVGALEAEKKAKEKAEGERDSARKDAEDQKNRADTLAKRVDELEAPLKDAKQEETDHPLRIDRYLGTDKKFRVRAARGDEIGADQVGGGNALTFNRNNEIILNWSGPGGINDVVRNITGSRGLDWQTDVLVLGWRDSEGKQRPKVVAVTERDKSNPEIVTKSDYGVFPASIPDNELVVVLESTDAAYPYRVAVRIMPPVKGDNVGAFRGQVVGLTR